MTGDIPSYAAGTLYRSGPGGYQVNTDKGTTYSASHWFDGFSQVHRFQILPSTTPDAPRKVLYNSRTTVDKMLEHIRKTGTLAQFTFGQKRDPCQSYFKKVMTAFSKPETVDSNIGVTISFNPPGFPSLDKSATGAGERHASALPTMWSKTDASVRKQLDPETLEPIGIANQEVLHPDLIGAFSAAHAKSDPTTGDVYSYNLDLGRKPTYRVFRVSASTGKTDILATIDSAPAAYLHSLFLSQKHVILCIWNSHYALGGVKLMWERNILDAITPLDPTKTAKWYVIDREGGGLVATYDSDPFFCFHTINAWEEPSASSSSQDDVDIVADLVAYDNIDVLKRFYYENLKSTSPTSRAYIGQKGESARPYFIRWRLPSIKAGSNSSGSSSVVGSERRAQREFSTTRVETGELPTIHPGKITQPYRYYYGVADRGKATFVDGLIKFDTQTRIPTYWQCHGHSPGEPIFIPDPNGADEGDGVLLSVVLDGFKGKSYLLCLDAKTMTERGRASMESVVAFGFHGIHVPAAVGARAVDS